MFFLRHGASRRLRKFSQYFLEDISAKSPATFSILLTAGPLFGHPGPSFVPSS